MAKSFLLVLMISLHHVATLPKLYAQKTPPGQRLVTVKKEDIRFAELFSIVWDQTRLQAFYNDEQLSSDERVTVNL